MKNILNNTTATGNADTLSHESENQDDECHFNGDIHAWEKALSLEIEIEKQIMEEEEEPDKGTTNMINLLKGITKTKEASNESSATAAQDLESEDDYLNAPGIDESLETDVLNLSVASVKRALLDEFLEPVLRERGIKVNNSCCNSICAYNRYGQVSTGDKNTYPCQLCLDRGRPTPVFKTASHYEGHRAYCRSPWKELEQAMKSDNSTFFYCPAGDFVVKTAQKVFNHMITDKCINCEGYVSMKAEHDKSIAHFHKRPVCVPSEAVILHDNAVSVWTYMHLPFSMCWQELRSLEEGMKWFYDDEALNLRGVAESAYGPHLDGAHAIEVDWKSLGLLELKELDFNAFRSQKVLL